MGDLKGTVRYQDWKFEARPSVALLELQLNRMHAGLTVLYAGNKLHAGLTASVHAVRAPLVSNSPVIPNGSNGYASCDSLDEPVNPLVRAVCRGRSILKAIIISDDLTGAAEVAGAAVRLGVSAEVHIDEIYRSEADVIAIDANTRSLNPTAAATVNRRLTKQAMEYPNRILVKKVDSVLRGPVLAELDAMLVAANLDRCVLVCSNPRKRRLLLEGHVWVDGVPLHATEFASDPEHPRLSSSALGLLQSGSRWEAQVDSKSISRDLRVVNPGESWKCGISIGNVSSTEQLKTYAEDWRNQRESVLAAGAAEFIETLLERCVDNPSKSFVEGVRFASFTSNDRLFLVSGTRNPHDDGWTVVHVPYEHSSSESIVNVCRSLEQKGKVAIRVEGTTDSSSDMRLHRITHVAKEVIVRSRPDQVWIEGGGTASDLLRGLGYQRLNALSNLGDGVVALRPTQEGTPLFVVKPGSYPWPKADRLELPSNSKDRWRETA